MSSALRACRASSACRSVVDVFRPAGVQGVQRLPLGGALALSDGRGHFEEGPLGTHVHEGVSVLVHDDRFGDLGDGALELGHGGGFGGFDPLVGADAPLLFAGPHEALVPALDDLVFDALDRAVEERGGRGDRGLEIVSRALHGSDGAVGFQPVLHDFLQADEVDHGGGPT